MVLLKSMDRDIQQIIKRFVKNNRADSLVDLEINADCECMLLYPTTDLFLTEKQYEKIKQLLSLYREENFYVTQYDGSLNGLFSSDNPVYLLGKTTDYHEYYDLNLFFLSLLFSEKGNWCIFFEETFSDGIGLFVAPKQVMADFKNIYPDYMEGYNVYVSELTQNKCLGSAYFRKIKKLLKVE